MKFLTTATRSPKLSQSKLTYTRTSRKAIVNEVTQTITLTEIVTCIEVTLPAFWQGLKDAVSNLFGGLFLPKVYAF